MSKNDRRDRRPPADVLAAVSQVRDWTLEKASCHETCEPGQSRVLYASIPVDYHVSRLLSHQNTKPLTHDVAGLAVSTAVMR